MKNIETQASLTLKKNMTTKEVKDMYPGAQIEVAPGIFQSVEDFEANHAHDEARDNELTDNK